MIQICLKFMISISHNQNEFLMKTVVMEMTIANWLVYLINATCTKMGTNQQSNYVNRFKQISGDWSSSLFIVWSSWEYKLFSPNPSILSVYRRINHHQSKYESYYIYTPIDLHHSEEYAWNISLWLKPCWILWWLPLWFATIATFRMCYMTRFAIRYIRFHTQILI